MDSQSVGEAIKEISESERPSFRKQLEDRLNYHKQAVAVIEDALSSVSDEQWQVFELLEKARRM